MTAYATESETGPVDVVCLAPAGASAREFVRWQGASGPACRIVPVDLPGRGRRMRQAAETTLAGVVDRLFGELPRDRPYALLGHSFGGLVAYELARRARAEDFPLPRFLVVAGCRPPHDVRSGRFGADTPLSDEEVLDALDAEGLLSSSLRTSPAAGMVISTLRADLRLLARYVPPEPAEAALPVRISSWYGENDGFVPGSAAAGWRRYTSRGLSLRAFPDGHFFVQRHWRTCVELLADLVGPDGSRERVSGP